MSVINETGQDPAPVGLSEEARAVCRCLAAAGGSVPVAVVAALAYLPVPLTRRHLLHLVRVGVAVEVEGRFMAAPDAPPPAEPALDAEAWARAVGWYAFCAYEAARALGAVAPVVGTVVASAWPVPRFESAAEALAWYTHSHGELAWAVERAVEVGSDGPVWPLALLVANIAAVAGPIGAWEKVLGFGLAAASRRARRCPRAAAGVPGQAPAGRRSDR